MLKLNAKLPHTATLLGVSYRRLPGLLSSPPLSLSIIAAASGEEGSHLLSN
jgi:hypothetical protein